MGMSYEAHLIELREGGRIWLEVAADNWWDDFMDPEEIVDPDFIEECHEISTDDFDGYGFSALPEVHTLFGEGDKEIGMILMEDAAFDPDFLTSAVTRFT